jgi:NIMA-interacting peptidyl-prolyl cis-trans isomerase 4
MGKDGAKAKGKEASGKGKQAGGGGGADKGGAADKGKGKKESKSDGLGTCTYVKGMKLLCFSQMDFSLSLFSLVQKRLECTKETASNKTLSKLRNLC